MGGPSAMPPYSATVVERLEAAGGIVVGKTNCGNFCFPYLSQHYHICDPH